SLMPGKRRTRPSPPPARRTVAPRLPRAPAFATRRTQRKRAGRGGGSAPSRPLRLLERDEIGTNRRSRSVVGIAASAAPPRNDGDMVIASAATQSPARCARIAASAAPPRHDGDMVIASVATQSPALCAGIPVALPVATG